MLTKNNLEMSRTKSYYTVKASYSGVVLLGEVTGVWKTPNLDAMICLLAEACRVSLIDPFDVHRIRCCSQEAWQHRGQAH